MQHIVQVSLRPGSGGLQCIKAPNFFIKPLAAGAAYIQAFVFLLAH